MESVSDFVISVDDTRRPFVCEKCGESFPEQAELLQHMSIRGHDILRNKPGNEVRIQSHLPNRFFWYTSSPQNYYTSVQMKHLFYAYIYTHPKFTQKPEWRRCCAISAPCRFLFINFAFRQLHVYYQLIYTVWYQLVAYFVLQRVEVARCLICSSLDVAMTHDNIKFVFRNDERLISHLYTHVNKQYSRLDRGITLELSFAIQT